jgi:hypothetical protein
VYMCLSLEAVEQDFWKVSAKSKCKKMYENFCYLIYASYKKTMQIWTKDNHSIVFVIANDTNSSRNLCRMFLTMSKD